MISSLSKGRATCSDYICAGCRPQSILFSSSGLNSNLVQSKKLSSEEKDVRHKRPQDPSNSPPEDIEQDYAVRSPVTNDAKVRGSLQPWEMYNDVNRSQLHHTVFGIT